MASGRGKYGTCLYGFFLDILQLVEYINAYMRYLYLLFLLLLLPATLYPLSASFAIAQESLTLKQII